MKVEEQIEVIEAELANTEQGSKEWKDNMQLLSKMYEIKNKKEEIAVTASENEVTTANETKRFWISAIKDVVVCVVGAAIAGAFQLLYIDEISEFEKNDTYTGRKKDFLPKGRHL